MKKLDVRLSKTKRLRVMARGYRSLRRRPQAELHDAAALALENIQSDRATPTRRLLPTVAIGAGKAGDAHRGARPAPPSARDSRANIKNGALHPPPPLLAICCHLHWRSWVGRWG